MGSGRFTGTSHACNLITRAVDNGMIGVKMTVLREGQRLDVMAQHEYGDASLWWVIAAASGIGWWLQVPPGTEILIPTSLRQVMGLVA